MTAEQLVKAIEEDRQATKDEEGRLREKAQAEIALKRVAAKDTKRK